MEVYITALKQETGSTIFENWFSFCRLLTFTHLSTSKFTHLPTLKFS